MGQAAVDDLTWHWARRYKWNATAQGYVYRTTRVGGRCGKNRRVYLHREILGLSFGDGMEADHLNGARWDNRACNLEVVTPEENKRRIGVSINRAPKPPVSVFARREIDARVAENPAKGYMG